MAFYYKQIHIEVPESVYEPQEDSELFAGVLENQELKGKSVLEIGCGSGFLSIVAAKLGANVTAVDINGEAVNTTKHNADANGVSVDVFESDLFSSVSGGYDIIIFNPPYLPVESGEKDKTYAGGETGRETIEPFVKNVKNHLKTGGRVLLLISSLTGEKEIIELFEKEGMKTSIVSREKISWEELMVVSASIPLH